MKALISPTDGELAVELGDDAITSSVPEQKGADVLLYTPVGVWGMQRKKVPGDFISSVNDGRLSHETTLMAANCQYRVLVCEGQFRYYPDGTLAISDKVPGHYNYGRIQGIRFSIKYVKGVEIEDTDDIKGTARFVQYAMKYFSETKHLSLYTRPRCPRDWYIPSTSEIQSWILQSWDGIGPVTADHIIKHLGRMPLKWDCTKEELMAVPRLSRKKAEEIWNTLNEVSTGHVPTTAKGQSLLDRINQIKR